MIYLLYKLTKLSETDIQMLEPFFENIFVLFGGCVFQQTVGITMGTNCAPLLADFPLFVRSIFHTGTSHEKQQEASPIL